MKVRVFRLYPLGFRGAHSYRKTIDYFVATFLGVVFVGAFQMFDWIEFYNVPKKVGYNFPL